MSEEIFIAKNVDYFYPGGLCALRGINFSVGQGESVAILGANASGKSTLLHLLDGLYFAAGGEVRAFGALLTETGVETPPFSREFRKQVGFLFQNSDAQLFCATVEEEIAFGPLQLRLPTDEVKKRVDDTLRLFEIENLRERSPQTLSGGEKKKVALAGIIACGPKVILMDEPSAGLDPRTQAWLAEFIGALRKSGVALIISSHDLSFVAEISERALVLSEDHRLLFDGPVREALTNLDLLLSANLIHAHAHVHDGRVHMHAHLHEIWHEHQHGHEHPAK
jgi:cobalt/nickel transport system ATP-binding protein